LTPPDHPPAVEVSQIETPSRALALEWPHLEYSLTSLIMIVLIAQIVGIFDVAAIIAFFGVNVSMVLFG